MQARQLVEHVCEPLALGLPVDVEAQHGIVQWLVAHGHLGGEGLLREVLECS